MILRIVLIIKVQLFIELHTHEFEN